MVNYTTSTSKLKHFVPLRYVVSVKHCFVGHRKSLEEVFLYSSKNYVKYSLLPAGLFKPNLNFELITPETRISFFWGREEKMKANSTKCSQPVTRTGLFNMTWSLLREHEGRQSWLLPQLDFIRFPAMSHCEVSFIVPLTSVYVKCPYMEHQLLAVSSRHI